MNPPSLHQQYVLLEGDQVTEYINYLSGCLLELKTNDFYPSAQQILHGIDVMDPEVNGGLYTTLKVHPRTGLPLYGEFVRVLSDSQLAEKELGALETRTIDGTDGIYGRLHARKKYLQLLLQNDVFREHTGVQFRKIDRKNECALFRLTQDRFSPEGLIERTTVEFTQKNRLWGLEDISLDGNDVADIREDLKGMVYRLSPLDASVVYCRLSDSVDLVASKVTKGSVGPFFFKGLFHLEPTRKLSEQIQQGAVLSAGLQVAGTEHETDIANDPLFLKFALSSEAREQFCCEREIPFFSIFCDRKFAICDEDVTVLKNYVNSKNTKNIIYHVE